MERGKPMKSSLVLLAVTVPLVATTAGADWIDIFNANRAIDLTVMDKAYGTSSTETGFWLSDLEVTESDSVQAAAQSSTIDSNFIGFGSLVSSYIPWTGDGAVNNASSSLSANVELFESGTAAIDWEFDLESTAFGSALAEITISNVRGDHVFVMSEVDDTVGSEVVELNPGLYLVQMLIRSEVTDDEGRGVTGTASVTGIGTITFVPAPGALALLGMGLMGRTRRRRR